MTNKNYRLEILTGAAIAGIAATGCKAIPSTAIETAFEPSYVQDLTRQVAGVKNALTNPAIMPGVYTPSLKVQMDGSSATIEYRREMDPKSPTVKITITDGKVTGYNNGTEVEIKEPVALDKIGAQTMYDSWKDQAKEAQTGVTGITSSKDVTELNKAENVYVVKDGNTSYLLDFAADGTVEKVIASTGKLEVVMPSEVYDAATKWKTAYDARTATAAPSATPTPSASEGLETIVGVESTPVTQTDTNWTDPLIAIGLLGYVFAAGIMKSPIRPIVVAAKETYGLAITVTKGTYNLLAKPFRKAARANAAAPAERLEVLNEIPAADPSGLPLTPDGSSGPATIALQGAKVDGDIVLDPTNGAPAANLGNSTESLTPIDPEDQPPQPPTGGGNSAAAA